MNTTLSTSVDTHHQYHPPQPVARVRRVRLADRVALHLGLALITWSRRPNRGTVSRENLAQRLEREWQAERRLRLTLPPR